MYPRTPERFTARAEDYARYRPGYPPGVMDWLRERCGLGPGKRVADVGAGTGLFTRQLLATGADVVGIEPNAAMRAQSGLPLRAGTAEATGLPDASCDLVTAAQAYHWFEPVAARAEWCRILRPEGWAVLLWNWRDTGGTPFAEALEALLERRGADYKKVAIEHWDVARIRSFFAAAPIEEAEFANEQSFDREGLRGRVLSASYMPRRDDASAPAALTELDGIFDAHQRGGRVRMTYRALVFAGRLGPQ